MLPSKLDCPHPSHLEEESRPAITALRDVLRIRQGDGRLEEDQVIEEVPVALVYNGISHAVMLASPADLEDFALGFSLGEGIVEHAREIRDIDIHPGCHGITVEMEIATPRFLALKERRRSLAGRTGCGLCGVDSLAALAAHAAPAATRTSCNSLVSVDAVGESLRQLPHWQPLRESTGASHGAAWVDGQGNIRCLREDVGRHNALDKLIGALSREGVATTDGFVLITSRASYEMVQKAARAGISALVAVSAPTALAIHHAEAADMLLVGFARSGQCVAYSGAQRLAYRPSQSVATHPLM